MKFDLIIVLVVGWFTVGFLLGLLVNIILNTFSPCELCNVFTKPYVPSSEPFYSLPHNLTPEQVEWNCRLLNNSVGCNGVLP